MRVGLFRLEQPTEGGEFGPETVLDYYQPCRACNRESSIARVEVFDLVLSYWGGGDLFSCPPEFAITDGLAETLKSRRLSGFELAKMKVSLSDDYTDSGGGHLGPVHLNWLKIQEVVDGPLTNYSLIGVCKKCDRDILMPQFRQEEAVFDLPKQSVIQHSAWRGQDIFRGREPGTVFITDRFVSALDSIGSQGYRVTPALWA